MGVRGDQISEERQLALLVGQASDYAIFMLRLEREDALALDDEAVRARGEREPPLVRRLAGGQHQDQLRAALQAPERG